MIASTHPYFVLFHHGFIRRTIETYSTKNSDLKDLFIHLTNAEA